MQIRKAPQINAGGLSHPFGAASGHWKRIALSDVRIGKGLHVAVKIVRVYGRKLRGTEALRMGLVSQVHPREELAAATHAYAKEMAEACSPRSLRVLKQQLWELPFQSLHEAVASDSAAMLEANTCEDFQEGKRAFMEKRPPRFTGC